MMDKLKHFKPSLITKRFFPYERKWPIEINRGRCFQWSYLCYCMFDGITLCDSGGLKNAMGSHAFVKYRHKYYDSEVLQGVYDYNELPGIAYTSKQLVIHTPDTFADDWASQAERFCISFDDMEDWAQSVLRSIANDS